MASTFKALFLGCGLQDYYSQFDSEQLNRKRKNLWMLTLFTTLGFLAVLFTMDYFFSFGEKGGYVAYFSAIALYPVIEADRKKRVRVIKRILESRS